MISDLRVAKLLFIKEAYLRTRSVEEDDNYDQERETEAAVMTVMRGTSLTFDI